LRELTSDIDCGKKFDGHPIHLNSNKSIIEHLKFHKRFLNTLRNRDFEKHFSNDDTYYFTANGRQSSPESLLMIDIDCKNGEKGAMQFAEFLKNSVFKGMYCEVSTNGVGAHGYVILEKQSWHPAEINDLLKTKLATWLRHVALPFIEANLISDVEVKGTFALPTWEKGELIAWRAGQLAKLPRNATLEDLNSTTRIDPLWLDKLPNVPEPAKILRIKLPSLAKKGGSKCGKCIGDDELERFDDYLQIAKSLTAKLAPETLSGKAKVTEEDIAVFLMIGKFFSNNMNKDGSLPMKRWEGMWQALYRGHDVRRQFDHHRWTALRNYLSALGLLSWEDNSYSPGSGNVKGFACKWQFGNELLRILEKEGEEETSLVVTTTLDRLNVDQFECFIRPCMVFSIETEREKLTCMEEKALEILSMTPPDTSYCLVA